MFNKTKLKDILFNYKCELLERLRDDDEMFKWKAVKCFQNNWDEKAADFALMLEASLSKTDILLASANYMPKMMIQQFAKSAPEEVRAMFIALFDETRDVYDRIESFKAKSSLLLDKYGNNNTQHFQTESAISTYLWLKYPDKYYIYKFGMVKTVADKLEADYGFKKADYVNNLKNCFAFYDEIRDELMRDDELISMLGEQLDSTCCPDPKLNTLTFDVAFYISQNCEPIPETFSDVWLPKDYSPAISVSEWISLINNPNVFTPARLEIMNQILANGGQATCTQLASKYGKTANYYNSNCTQLAMRVAKEKGLSIVEIYPGKKRWWPILFLGKHAKQDEDGAFVWKLHDELKSALQQLEHPVYTRANFLDEVYMTEDDYMQLQAVLRNKKNIILQGAPGVGKTFAAKRLAWSMMGEIDDSRVEFIQFHQNYSYEDFVMGYKPVADGFELRYGVFYRFCQEAAKQPDKEFFFIIDEINRGNMSKIFGELLMLIERDYRDTKITLAYDGQPFSVPKNLYIIGMMNTADRSLAMIDYALRRRFSFFDMKPGFDSKGFKSYLAGLNNETLNKLVERVEELNKDITADKSLGEGFCIGHSYFCGQTECTKEWLNSIVNYDILPMLREYWFDETTKLQRWENTLHDVLK